MPPFFRLRDTMLLIDAVNHVLPKLGEHPVTSTHTKHPSLAIILPIFDETRRECLSKGWWFNEFDYTLYPDAEGTIELPSQTLSFTPAPWPKITCAVRGSRLFNGDTLEYTWSGPIHGRIRIDVPFEELPETVANFIKWEVTVQAYQTDIGQTTDVDAWKLMSAQAGNAMLAEHLRQRRHNTRNTSQARRVLNSAYTRGY